jgi:hypothetical protein
VVRASNKANHAAIKYFILIFIIFQFFLPSKTGFILSTRACHLSFSMAHRNPYNQKHQHIGSNALPLSSLKYSPFSLLQIQLLLWFPWEEGASAPSSFSSPSRHLPLPHPSLPASFEANLLVSAETLSASLEVLSAFSEAICSSFPAMSLFSSTSNLGSALHRPRLRTQTISEDFRFDFFKFRSIFFRKSKPETSPSTVFKGPSASRRSSQHVHPATTSRRMALTRARVRSTRRRVILMCRSVDRFLPRVTGSSDPLHCRRPFLRVGAGYRHPVTARVVHAPVTGVTTRLIKNIAIFFFIIIKKILTHNKRIVTVA